MIHEVLPDRLMTYVNQAHDIYIKNVSKIRT